MSLKFNTLLGIDPLKAAEDAKAAKRAAKMDRERQDHVYLEFSGPNPKNKSGMSHKFWEAWVHGDDIVIRFGSIGTEGRTDRIPCISNSDARADLAERIRRQRNKGYGKSQVA